MLPRPFPTCHTPLFIFIGFLQGRDGLDRSGPQVPSTYWSGLASLVLASPPFVRLGANLNHHHLLFDAGQNILHTPSQPQKEMLPHVSHPSSAFDTPRNPPVRDSDFPKSCQSGSLRLPALNHLPATVRGPLQLNSSFDYFGGIRSLDPWSQLAPANRILESNPARYRSTYWRYRASVALKAPVPFVSSHGYLEQAILPAPIWIPFCLLFLVDVF